MADKLYLIRHGRTQFNKEGRLRGHKDIPLDDIGKRDAKIIASKLAKLDPDIETVYCSDLQRSQQTAAPIAEALKAKVEVRPELRPWHLGGLAGQKVSSILPLLEWYTNHPNKKVSRGEAYNDFFVRWTAFLKAQMAASKGKDNPDAVVIHARHMLSLDIALAKLAGKEIDTSKVPSTGGPNPGAVVVITLSGRPSWKQLIPGQGDTVKIS